MRPHPVLKALVDHPVGVLMAFIAAVVFGSVSLKRLPVDLMPDISYPSLTVRTEVPGAAPEEVEEQVSRPLEESLATIQGLVNMESRSRAELSDVVLEFGWGTDMNRATQDVRERTQLTWLPEEVQRPLVLRYDPSLDPMLRVVLSTTAQEADEEEAWRNLYRLREIADHELKPMLEAMEGVAAARVRGGLERQILVEPRSDWLASQGLELEQLRRALIAHNVNISGGSIRQGDTEYLIRTLNEFTTLEEIRSLPVRRADGRSVRLGDVALVRDAHKDRELVAWLDGREAVELEIHREADANVVAVAQAVKTRLGVDGAAPAGAAGGIPGSRAPPTFLETVPDDVVVKTLDDQAAFIEAAIDNLVQTALLGGALAITILFLFLRDFRATGIIATAIPVSVICAFAPMHLAGLSLNLMSLGGLALGVGMLVDNAVVVLESIQTSREQGLPEKEAAVAGAGDVAGAVTASTFTTVAVFLPITFVEGVAGQVFGDLAMAVVFSLLASLVVALCLVPMLAARTVTRPAPGPLHSVSRTFSLPSMTAFKGSWRSARGWRALVRPWLLVRLFLGLLYDLLFSLMVLVSAWLARGAWRLGATFVRPMSRGALWASGAFGKRYDRLASSYEGLLGGALRRPGTVLGVSALLFFGAMGAAQGLGLELIPQVHQGRFTVEAAMPVGTPIERTTKVMAQVEEAVRALPGVAGVHLTVGTEREADAEPERGEHWARIGVELNAGSDIKRREMATMARIRELLDSWPELDTRIVRPSLFTFQVPVEVLVKGADLESLRALADRTAADISAVPGLQDVRSSMVTGHPEIRVTYDREKLTRLGLSPRDVAESLRSGVQGATARELTHGQRRVEILLRLAHQDRASLDALRRLSVGPDPRLSIPLEAVATLEEGTGPAEIRRVDQERAAVVSASLEGVNLSGTAARIRQAMDKHDWPAGFDYELAGQNREMEASLGSMRFALLLSIFLVYAIMAATFESLLHPIVILGALPMAAVGVVAALLPLSIPLSVVVLIGFIVLSGVVVNNAIVLVDAINRRRRHDGMSLSQGVEAAARMRLRPILITTSTTILGLAPLAMGLGAGAEIQRPLALTVVAGLASSALLTLLVMPVLYHQLVGLVERHTRPLARAGEAPEGGG